MATRLYITSAQSTLTFAFDASWEQTAGSVRTMLMPERTGTPFLQVPIGETSVSTTFDVLIAQFLSPALTAQTVSGNLKGQIRALESAADADLRAQMLVRVVSANGSTVRGTLLAHDASALTSEFDVVLTNRKFPLAWTGSGAALTPVVAELGDRIVVEVGYRAHNATATGKSATLEFGDASATDLAEDETSTVQNNSWLEFSNTLNFDYSSGRFGASTAHLTELGRSNQGPSPAGGAFSQNFPAGVPEGQLCPGFRSARTKGLGIEAGPTPSLANTGYYADIDSIVEGADSTTLRFPLGGGTWPVGTTTILKFKMRALASPGPGYITWVVQDDPDFTGTQAPSAIQVGTAVIADTWREA